MIEGYEELGIKSEAIASIWNSEFIDKLRLFRNGTFHYQKDIYSSKIFAVDDTDEFVNWIYKFHNAIGKAILEEMKEGLPKEEVERIFKSIKEATGNDLESWLAKK